MKIDKELIKKNKIPIIIISIGILIRLYYTIITANQPLWWDEAEYLLMAKYFGTGKLLLGLLASRPLLMPVIFAFFIKFGLTQEIFYRIFEFLISSLALVFLYLATKELFDKETAAISTLLLSVFYLHLFYTSRILLDSIAPTLWIISIYFFAKGYIINKNNKKFYLSAFFGAIGVFFYNQTIALFLVYFIFLLIIEKTNLFKEKRFYIFGIVAIITFLPNLILNQIIYKNPIEFVTIGLSVGEFLTANYTQNILIYASYMPVYLGTLLLIIFLISLFIIFHKLLLGIDLAIKKPDLEDKKLMFLFFWLIISFLAIIKIVGHFEDRYIMPAFLPIFIISALGITKAKNHILKPTNKLRVYSVIIILLVIISFTQLKQADKLIKEKKESFLAMKEAGLWIKERSTESDKTLASFSPMLAYYSDRLIISFPATEDELIPLIEKEKPKYMVISVFSSSPNYIDNIKNYENLIPVQIYKANEYLLLAILEIKYNQ